MASTQRLPRQQKRRSINSREGVCRTAANDEFNPIDFDGKKVPAFVGMAVWYCRHVVAENVPTCLWERLACRRFLDMLEQSKSPDCKYTFSPDHVTDFCLFFESLPHVKGFEGTYVMEPVQCWWAAAIFGFRNRKTGLRWTRAAEIWIPRKNAKTALAVGIVLYCLTCEGEAGAEGLVSAGSEKQANVPFKAILDTLDMEPDLGAEYGIEKNKDEVFFTKVRADLKKLAGLAPNLDGLNPHIVLAEELHAQKQDVISVLRTAQAARRQPLFLTISTAGRSTSSPAHIIFREGQKILMGERTADDVFICMYAADEGDALKRFDHKVLEKLNPLWGISLQEGAIGEEIRNALSSEANLQEYLRTRLNIWSKAAGTLFSAEDWDRCAKKGLDLDLMQGFPMYVGVDLASHSDLNAACFVVKVGDTLYATFKLWIPEDSERFNDDRFAADFRKWAEEGHLTLTRGDHVDHEKVLADVLDMIEGHNVQGFAFDDWQADFLMGQTEKRGYATFRVKKSPQQITRATDDLIARHRNKHLDPSVPADASKHRLQHDGNPVAAWCVGNVVGHYDNNQNVLPKKEDKNSKNSIDGLDAIVLANAARLFHEAGAVEDKKPKIVNHYLTHNLAGESE